MKRLTLNQLNEAIAELREPRPAAPETSLGTPVWEKTLLLSPGSEWALSSRPVWGWCPFHLYTTDIAHAMLLFEELPDGALQHWQRPMLTGESSRWRCTFRASEGYYPGGDAGSAPWAVALAWFHWKSGEAVEIVEDDGATVPSTPSQAAPENDGQPECIGHGGDPSNAAVVASI